MRIVSCFSGRSYCSKSLLASGIALICGTAIAQDTPLETVIVTAEFREADVQDTPIAITAVNASMLEARSQTNIAEITAQAPNVSLRPAGSSFGNALVAFIRGIGQTDFNPSVEPGVGMYVDDVYYATITGNVLDLLDLDRVEVLRGPQGTLAGRNAIGGAIKLYTRKPDGNDDVSVSLTLGDYDRTEIRGSGGLTLVEDKLFLRVAGTSRSRDGYITRLDYACANNLPAPGNPGGLPTYAPTFGCELGEEGGQSYTAGRLSLRWVASDNFEVNLSANVVNDDSESQPGVLIAAKNNSGSNFPWYTPNGPGFGADPFTCIAAGVVEPWADCALNNPAFSPTSGALVPVFYDNNGNGAFDAGIDVPYDNRFVTDGTYTNYATYINDGSSTPSPFFQGGTSGADTSVYKPYIIEPVNRLDAKDISINLDWQLSDNWSFLSVSAYREYVNSFAEDTDGSPLAVQQLLQVMDHEQWTQELRLNGTLGDGAADLTVGVFYLDKETAEDARVDLPYVGFDFIHGPDLVPSTNKAVYSHLTLHPSDRVDLSFGLRYSEDEKSYTFRRRNPDLSPVGACTTFWFWEAGNPSNCGVFGLDTLSVSYSSDVTDWRAAVSYSFDNNTMIYFQGSSGYKAGGNNARPFFPTQLNAFEPEELVSIEFGAKSTIGGRARLNAAIFLNDYSDIQLPTNVCAWAPVGQQTPCASQNNVGDADVWGVEFEAEWHPTDTLSIDGSVSHLDFEYQSIIPGATAVTLGMITPYTPEDKISLGIQNGFSVGSNGSTLTPRLDVSYQSEVYGAAVNAPTNLIDDFTLVNARLTWLSAEEDWQVSLEMTNISDEYYYLTKFDLWDAAGYVHGQPARPSEWALSVKRSF